MFCKVVTMDLLNCCASDRKEELHDDHLQCSIATSKRRKASDAKSTEKDDEDGGDRTDRNFDAEIRELFRLFDTNNDRSISIQELGKAMRFLGMSPTQQEIQDAMRTLDVNGNGRIEFQEFFSFMQAEMAKVESAEYAQNQDVIRSAFRTFDKDGNGFIDEKELRVAMKKLGECLTDQELNDMMKQADIDGDGKINYEEFVKIWCEAT